MLFFVFLSFLSPSFTRAFTAQEAIGSSSLSIANDIEIFGADAIYVAPEMLISENFERVFLTFESFESASPEETATAMRDSKTWLFIASNTEFFIEVGTVTNIDSIVNVATPKQSKPKEPKQVSGVHTRGEQDSPLLIEKIHQNTTCTFTKAHFPGQPTRVYTSAISCKMVLTNNGFSFVATVAAADNFPSPSSCAITFSAEYRFLYFEKAHLSPHTTALPPPVV